MAEDQEGDLGSATDYEWLEAHKSLQELVKDDPNFPNEELAYFYNPDIPAEEITPANLTTDGGRARG